MKRSRQLAFAIAVFLITAASAFALDMGANLDNTTGFNYQFEGSATQTQRDKLALWLMADIGKYLKVSIQGSALFKLEEPYLFYDLDYAMIEGDFPKLTGEVGIFKFDAGRIFVSDFTGKVLAHKIDGVNLELGFPFISLSAGIGYTGFLFKHSANIFLSRADEDDQADDDRYFAPPRLVGSVGIRFPELLLRQTLNLAFLYQFDLRQQYDIILEGTTSESTTGGLLDSQYSGIGLSGPIVPPLYYDAFFYFNTGRSLSYVADASWASGYSYQYKPILAFLTGGSIKLFLTELLKSRIELKFIFSSGDRDYEDEFLEGNTAGHAGTFVAINNPAFGLIFSPKVGNIYVFDLGYSFMPFSEAEPLSTRSFQIALNAMAFFRPEAAQISEALLNTENNHPYLGTEVDAKINIRAFSDLGMAFKWGLFFPNAGEDGAFLQGQKHVELYGQVEISLGL
jgi:hypothetical protein